jgi:hypothetical protein
MGSYLSLSHEHAKSLMAKVKPGQTVHLHVKGKVTDMSSHTDLGDTIGQAQKPKSKRRVRHNISVDVTHIKAHDDEGSEHTPDSESAGG